MAKQRVQARLARLPRLSAVTIGVKFVDHHAVVASMSRKMLTTASPTGRWLTQH